ncbi:MAG: hypothetical protein DI605_03275 [Sphingomonas sp.]|nr:MAG: hypothetical protein DI605_03275 [Sphingomonas sp.]
MLSEGRWSDITILNMSSRGLMARTGSVPKARSYVEIRRGKQIVIVGKVVWHDAQHFGIQTQDRISIGMIEDGTAADGAEPHDPAVERRAQPRASDPAEAFERNRQRAAIFQFSLVVAGGAAGALLIANMVMKVLGTPFATIASHLA